MFSEHSYQPGFFREYYHGHAAMFCLLQTLQPIRDSQSIVATQELCKQHGEKALQALTHFAPSSSRTALEDIVTALTTFPNS